MGSAGRVCLNGRVTMTPADTESSDRALEKLLREINEISTLPHIVSRVMQAAHNPASSASDLMKIVETDAALSTRVLKCVNSAAYGLRNRITNLQHAISYMGFKQVVNLAVSAAVCDIFQGDTKVGPYSRMGLWRHVVSVAVVSRMIAIRQKMQNFEEAFLAGLLHDIGIILEDQYAHEPFMQMMRDLAPGRSLILCRTRCAWIRPHLAGFACGRFVEIA